MFRAMVPLVPETLPQLAQTPVLISNGRVDPLVSADETEQLASLLRSAGAEVTVSWQNSGHELTERDVVTAREWLAQQQAR
jgi:predicted esterase